MLSLDAQILYKTLQPWISKYKQLSSISTEKQLLHLLDTENVNVSPIISGAIKIHQIKDVRYCINTYISNLFNDTMMSQFRWSHRQNDELSFYEDGYLSTYMHQVYNIELQYCEQILNLVKYMVARNHYELWVDFEAWENPKFSPEIPLNYDDFKHLFSSAAKPKWYFKLLHYGAICLTYLENMTRVPDTLAVNLLSSPIGAIIFGSHNIDTITTELTPSAPILSPPLVPASNSRVSYSLEYEDHPAFALDDLELQFKMETIKIEDNIDI
jgi:hypothetical protein